MSLRLRSSSSDGARRRSERLTAEEEKMIAREIRKAEQVARECVAGIDAAERYGGVGDGGLGGIGDGPLERGAEVLCL